MRSTAEITRSDTPHHNSVVAYAIIIRPWLALALLLTLSLWLRWRYTWVQGFHYDEGHWLMFALLVNDGHPAYTETFVGIPPLALWIIQAGAVLFGPTLSARYPMMLFSLVGVGSLFWWFQPTKSALGLTAGLLAGTLLSFAPLYFTESVSLMAEAPAVSLSLLSLVLAQQYVFNQKLYWFFLSGFAFALSLALKIFVVFLPAVIGLLILLATARSKDTFDLSVIRRLFIEGGVWLVGVSLPLLVFLLTYNPQAMYQQVIAFRFVLRQATLATLPGSFLSDNLAWLSEHVTDYGLLVVGAVLGAAAGWRKQRLDVLIWSTWLILGIMTLIWHVPLRDRYFMALLPGLAALSGLLLAKVLHWLYSVIVHKMKDARLRQATVVLLLAILIALPLVYTARLAFSPISIQWPDYLFDVFSFDRNQAITFVKENTLPGDCLVTDDQRIAIAAQRPIPPALSETSFARLKTGWLLTVDTIAQQIDANDCPLVVYATERFDRREELSARLRRIYFLEINYTDQATVFVAKKHTTHSPDQRLDAQLGDTIILQGIDLTPAPWHPEQDVLLATYWSALNTPDRAYKIFVQLRNESDQTVAVYDHFPFPVPEERYQFVATSNQSSYQITPHIDDLQLSPDDIASYPQKGMLPTNAWPAGQTIREVHTINLPANLPAGKYNLFIGMYDPDTQARLPVQTETEPDDDVLAAQIEIKAVR